MNIDKNQLEINVNLYSMNPDFLNYELHYVIAANENTFRFATWNETPAAGEVKYYFFRTDRALYLPAGNITLQPSYVLTDTPLYQCVSGYEDFVTAIEKVRKEGVGKSIRCFSDEQTDAIKQQLEEKFGVIEKHQVSSAQGQHVLLVFNEIEISISATMIYFRHKTVINEEHYQHVKEEKGKEDLT